MLTRRAAIATLASAALATRARADGFPTHTVTIVVPYPPGGPIDLLARLIGQDSDLGQTVIVENRPGGSGIIGTNVVAKAAPDGYTLVLGTNQTHATNQSLIKGCPYDAVRDFAPVAGIAAMPHVLVTRNSLAVKDLAELVALAKEKPGTLTFGSTGNGSGAHLAGELFKTKAGVDLLHVPFKGLAPMTTEMLADRIDVGILPLPGLIAQMIAAGKVRALAVASLHRAAQLPEVPTFGQAGVAGVEADAWSALFAPAKTPADVIDRLYGAVAAALKKESVQAALDKQGLPIALKSPAEMSAMLPAEVSKWAEVIKVAHVTVE